MLINCSAVPSGQELRYDASYSKNYLTRHNYRGPQLLRSIRVRPNRAPPESPAIRTQTSNTGAMQDIDILADPISSDEDEVTPTKAESRASTPSSAKRNAEDIEHLSPPRKRQRNRVNPTRSSGRTATSSKLEPVPQSTENMPDFPDMGSQSSQRRKHRTKYGKTSFHNRPSSQEVGFADPGCLPSTPRKGRGESFIAPDGLPSSRKRTPNKKIKELEIPSSSAKSEQISAAFKVPDVTGLPLSSSTSTELSNTFNVSPETLARKRSSSTSSLSSTDSIASHELSQKQKDEINNGTALHAPVPKGCARCPLCQHIVDLSTCITKVDPTILPLRKQQIFCNNHRLSDAQAKWQAKGYPTIDWNVLENKRIPNQVLHLRQVLYRKSPSFYLDSLESKIKEAKGNPTKIRRYLATDIVEVVKTGFYGPKGAKIMGHKITTEMSNHLKRSLKADKTVRAVGVSGFVSAVLLPELLQQIVMEDMDISLEDEARKAISESTDMGMLLWPDDDHVDRDVENAGDEV